MLDESAAPSLKRALTLPLLVLYGLGVTVGAGIYVLIGAVAHRRPALSRLRLDALVMSFTALSYSELTTRFPVSAGVAAFVLKGFRSRGLSRAVGLLVIAVGLVSAAAIASGSVGYLRHFIDLPPAPLLVIVVFAMAAIAAYGIVESAMFTAVLGIIEVGGLVVIIVAGFVFGAEPVAAAAAIAASAADPAWWPGILAAGLLAFFAFIGSRVLPRGRGETTSHHAARHPADFGISFAHMGLAITAVIVMTPAELAGSPRLQISSSARHRLPPWIMSLVAIGDAQRRRGAMIGLAPHARHGAAERFPRSGPRQCRPTPWWRPPLPPSSSIWRHSPCRSSGWRKQPRSSRW
jgi:amino acid transporter